uniref:uncharacterized protein C9orf85 homolog n=1 Tax=Monopterus albus TaxID=43700 RepID=UPI0009B40366|nr:uncharacterized protein C9orf85 homolog [Monopterus albus]
MSLQKGNVSRSRGQRHQNTTAFKNDKYGATVQVKKGKSKTHDGLCQHCKGVLEWKVKYNKYKPLTQPRKCVKCSQKTVKDAYHIICKPCSLQLEICCKCGKKENIVIPVGSHLDTKEEDGEQRKNERGRGKKEMDDFDRSGGYDDDDDDDDDFGHLDDEDNEDFVNNSGPETTQSKSAVLPDVSQVHVKD